MSTSDGASSLPDGAPSGSVPADRPDRPQTPDAAEASGVPEAAEPAEPAQAPVGEPVGRVVRLDAVARPETVRRAPRYRAFIQAGALAGLVVGVVVALVAPSTPTELGTGPVLVFVGGAALVVGAVLGGLVAVLIDRRQ